MIDDPQVRRERIPRASTPTTSRLGSRAAPMQFDDEMVEIRRGAPGIGEHTEEVLGELGYAAAELESLRTAGAID